MSVIIIKKYYYIIKYKSGGALTCKGIKMTDGGLTLFFFAASLMIASASSIRPRDSSHRGDSGTYLPREVKGTHGDTNYHCIFFLFSNNYFFNHKLIITLPRTTRKVYRVGLAVQELRAASSSLE